MTDPSDPAAVVPTVREQRRLMFSGPDLGRLLAFSDGVFAFAATLMAISLIPPTLQSGLSESVEASELAGQLNAQWYVFLAYAIAFFLIGSWWMTHQEVFRRLHGYDRGLLMLNVAFLALIALTPFTLGIFARYEANSTAVGWFAGVQALAGLAMAGICRYAMADRHLYDPTGQGVHLGAFADRALMASAVFAVSIGVGFVVPQYASLVWVAVFPIQVMAVRRRRADFRPPPAPAAPPGG